MLYDLKPAQKDVLFDQMLHPRSTKYNIGTRMDIDGPLDLDILSSVILLLTENIDVFNINIVDCSGVYKQSINKKFPHSLTVIDAKYHANVDEIANELIETYFDFFSQPLIRFVIIKTNHLKHTFIIFGHHLAIDGFGLYLLNKYVTQAYSEAILNIESSWIKNIPQYFSHSDKNEFRNERSKKFWSENYKQNNGNFISKRYAGENLKGSSKTYILPLHISEKLQLHYMPLGISYAHLISACLAIIFSYGEKNKTLRLGLPLHKRSGEAQKNIIGMFSGLVPCDIQYSHDLTFLELAENISKDYRKVMKYSSLSLSEISDACGFIGTNNHLFKVVINHERFSGELKIEKCESIGKHLVGSGEDIPLSIRIGEYELNAEVNIKISYLEEYFCINEIDKLYSQIISILEQVSNNSNLLCSYIDVIDVIDVIGATPDSTDLSSFKKNEMENDVNAKAIYVAPRSDVEKILCEICGDVLGVDSVGIRDNFFQLGGRSLSAVMLIARINQKFNVNMSMKAIFDTPTLEALGQALQQLDVGLNRQALTRLSRDRVLPLSFAQQRLWLLDQIDGSSAHYNMPSILKLSGRLDKVALNKAFTTILLRHESLRTHFAVDDQGEPYQVIQSAPVFDIAIQDLSHYDAGTRELAIADIAQQEANRAFDLSKDMMLRAQLLALSAEEHILLVTLHHIASDGWSVGILIDEFSRLYSAYVRGEETPLAPLEIQYADYAVWQREWLQGHVLDQQVGYWTTQLLQLPVVHSLPLDHARPALQRFAGAHHPSHIDLETRTQLMALCRSQEATLFMGLHAVFATLLSRYSNEDDIVIGSPIANREQAEVAPLIGFFVNTLVLRSDLSASPSFVQLLNQSKAMLLDAYAHQQVPFEQLVEKLQPERSLSHSPLFQVMLVLQNNAQSQLELPGLQLSAVESSQVIAKYDLTLYVTEVDEGLQLNWEYNTDVFEGSTITRMADHFNELLESLLLSPKENVFTANMLSEGERHQLLVEWNDTGVAYPKDKCVHELFERQVEQNPDAIAVIFEEEQLTYGELNERANQLAHYLVREKGVKLDTLVGICVERSIDMVVGILGILKAGGAYVPLDPEYPEARLAYMLLDANVSTVITQRELLSRVSFGEGQALCMDDELIRTQLDGESTKNIAAKTIGLHSNHLAYVIYTSGSTGNPKGVMVAHNALVNRIDWMHRQYGASSADRILQKTPFSFDVSVWEFVWPLTAGAGIVLAKPQGHKDALYLSALIQTHRITKLHFVPSMLNSMLLLGNWSQCTTLRQVFCSGEELPVRYVEEFYACCPWSELHNLYGPTEAAIDVSYWDCSHDHKNRERLPIGRPISNIQLQILDHHLNLVPQGIAGELHIGGVGLARGYLNRADLTAEKFIANPFYDKENPNSSERLYKTGDLVRWLPNGNVEFLGRIDHQVKIRGFRIELGEIESCLLNHVLVNDAIVLAKETHNGDKRLVGYVVAESSDEKNTVATIELLRQHLSATLPEYMIPTAFVLLDEFPLTPNGKVDRKALPEPDMVSQQHEYVAPRTETEKILCELWQEVLGVERVGITDNFFHLGGHSLLAMRLVSRINQAFNSSLPLKTLFVESSPEALGRALLSVGIDLHRPALTRFSRDRVLPLSFAQQRLWLLDQIDGSSAHYNMPSILKLSGRLDKVALNKAFTIILLRHESLRTHFAVDDQGEPYQVIQSAPVFDIAIQDLSHYEAGTRELAIADIAQQEANRAFDLSTDMMLRAQLLALSAEEHILLVTLHHIASDGWSVGILIDEFSRLYSAYVRGEETPLAPLEIQYADYAVWQREWLQGHVLDQQVGYWTTQLSQLPVVHSLPLDHARPALQRFAGAHHSSHIDLETRTQLMALCRSQEATLFMGLHAVFATLLSRYSNEDDIVIGSPIANREQAEVAPLIGFFVNTLVLRSDLSASPSFVQLLNQSKAMLLDAYAHQQVPFEQLVEKLQPERSLSHSPLFQVMLVLQNNAQSQLELPGLQLSAVESSQVIAKYDLTLYVTEVDEGLQLNWEYNTDVFEGSTITRMADHFNELLESLLLSPKENVFTANMLSEGERHQLLVEWNDTAAAYPKDTCIHELFERQVEQSPDAIAVIFEEEQLTYGELNERANQLAHYLVREKGVKPDTLVGICVERSLDMVVGIMGILKAGGAYVPLDPEYPEARLAYMLLDANVSTVITQREVVKRTPVTDAQAVCLDAVEIKEQIGRHSKENIDVQAQGLRSEHLAYVIYTSGSTGNPKGVMVAHKNTIAFLSWVHQTYDRSQLQCVLASTSFCFDLSIFELFAPLLMGGSTFIVKNILELQHCKNTHNISLINTVPSAVEMLLVSLSIPSSVKTINLAGELLKQKVVDQLYFAGIDAVYDLYGPSEDTTYSTFALRTIQGVNSIGRPIQNTQIYLLNKTQQLTGQGMAGEIYIGGAGLARGYLHRPELTAEKFIINPFYNPNHGFSSERLYRTGDLARWLPNGNLEYLGRIDHQVKIRGFRIELGEIENRLTAHAMVKDAIVLSKEYDNGDKRLIAYVIVESNTEKNNENNHEKNTVITTIELLRQHLSATLPEYMIPAAFVLLDEFPLSPNGKVDRKALPAPDMLSQQHEYIAPGTDTEKILCELWQEVLDVERVGIADNFFDLGGNSLSFTRLVVQINKTFNVVLPLKVLFKCKNLSEMNNVIVEATVLGKNKNLLKEIPQGIEVEW